MDFLRKIIADSRISQKIYPLNVNPVKDDVKQWRIQDFPDVGANSKSGIFLQLFCRKLHENERDPRGARAPGATLDPPM